MSDSELWLNLGYGEDEHIHRGNTRLYNFIGESALLGPHDVYDHIFITEEDEDGEMTSAAYIFKDNEHYEHVAAHIRLYNFEQHLNVARPVPLDVTAFEVTHGITDSEDLVFPEDWNDPIDARGTD